MPTLSLKDYLVIGFIVISATTGTLWWTARDARIRAEGAAEVYLASRDSARLAFKTKAAEADSAKAVSDSVTSHEAARVAILAPERERAMTRANVGEARIDTVTLGISERAGADSVVAGKAAREAVDSVMTLVVAPLRANSLYADSIIGSQARTIGTLTTSLKIATDALSTAQTEIEAARKADAARAKSQPGWVSRNLEKVAYGIVGALAALVVEHR